MSQLFLCSYTGTISTLRLNPEVSVVESLKEISCTDEGSPAPSWLSIDSERRLLYSTSNDRRSKTGTLTSFKIQSNGTLVKAGSVPGHFGAAHHTLFRNGKLLAVAWAFSSRITIYNVEDPSQIRITQDFSLENPRPGPLKHQDRAFPHQIIFDPTERYLISADMGADLIRVYRLDDTRAEDNAVPQLTELPPFNVARDFFARHAATVRLENGETRLYLVGEESYLLATYKVEYQPNDGGLDFQKLDEINVLSKENAAGTGKGPTGLRMMTAHLETSPDNKFLILSIRGDASFTSTSPFDPKAQISADSIVTYRIDPTTGALTFAHAASAGGSYPRQFSLTKSGDKFAVPAQRDGLISVYERDATTGEIEKLLGVKGGYGGGEMGPVCVVWDNHEG